MCKRKTNSFFMLGRPIAIRFARKWVPIIAKIRIENNKCNHLRGGNVTTLDGSKVNQGRHSETQKALKLDVPSAVYWAK